MSAPRRLIRALGKASREGGFVVLGAESADMVCYAGEVAAADDDGGVGTFGGVPAVGEERSQWRIEPSEPPEMRMGYTGCHARAICGQSVDDVSDLKLKA
jgi:hypothetical protein